MVKQTKYDSKPGLIGCFISVLLVVSFFLPRLWQNNSSVESFNTVLIVVIMCLCVHLVRITSSMYFKHVWNNIGFSILWLLPVFNLIVTACQFIWDELTFMTKPIFLLLLILFSLPSFCCYYFNVVIIFCKRNLRLIISTIILDIIWFLYVLIRVGDRVLLPVFTSFGNEITPYIDNLISLSPVFSLIIYILALINFIICAKLFSSEK